MNATTNHATKVRYTAALAAPVRIGAVIALVRAAHTARVNVRALTR